jgi:hypothetical protein
MAVILVTYDLKQPGRNYQPVHDYLKKFTYCKGLESVWLLDTTLTTTAIRDALSKLVDASDKTFAVRITKDWGSWNYDCADWLNKPERTF